MADTNSRRLTMDSFKQECALENTKKSWSNIDWKSCERSVERLQARIVKATQEKNNVKLVLVIQGLKEA